MPDSRDSHTGQRHLFSSPSTTTTATTTRSKSKRYNLRPLSRIPIIDKNIRKPPIRRKLMGKGSDWTASQELALLNILKDASVDGNVQNAAPNTSMWLGLTEKLNATTGMSRTPVQVQKKLRRMKKLRKRFYQLVHHETGFGWNPDTNTVSGTVAQWDSYLAVHKNAKLFRKKGQAKYQLMTELFASSTSTGALSQSCRVSPPNTDQEREFEEQLNGLGLEESHDPSTPPPSAARPPSPPGTSSGKRPTDLTSSIQLRSKRSRGISRADANSTELLKFVGALDRRNDILEQWMAMHNKATIITGHNHDEAERIDDPYSNCVLLMQTLLGQGETAVFLKGCKELENPFAQKAFQLMTDTQRKAWLFSL